MSWDRVVQAVLRERRMMRGAFLINLSLAATCLSLVVASAAVSAENSGSVGSAGQDQRAIYNAVLKSWLGSKYDKQFVNERLGPAPLASAPENAECSKGIRFVQSGSDSVTEETLPATTFDDSSIELVDGRTWNATDPQQGIASGKSVASAVEEAISRSLISFSRVSFSADHKDALVNFSMACGQLCGTGSTIHLRQSKGEWKIVGRCGGYVS
jgi:hypothetical protein